MYYDIWVNIHFGYLGKVGGFSDEQLFSGAAIENAASNQRTDIQDDASDTVANSIGISLFNTNSLSETSLLWNIYVNLDRLNKVELDPAGRFLRVYQ